jgi:hypothetical protein
VLYTTWNSLNTNKLTDGKLLSVICCDNYRWNFFRLLFRRYIPADYFGRYLPTEWQTKYSKLKKRAVRQRGSFCGWFYWQNHRGIQNDSSVLWRDWFTVRIANRLTEGFKPESSCDLFTVKMVDEITDGIHPSVSPSAKVNI